jgi:cell division protein FtsI (penicillin-binding protein 3)
LIPPATVGVPSVRHRLMVILVLVAVAALAGRLVWVQGLDASANAKEAVEQRTVERSVGAMRGDIVDRHGTVMARSVERYDIWVNQLQVGEYKKNDKKAGKKGITAAAEALAPVLGWSVKDTTKALTGDHGFQYLLKAADPEVKEAALALKIPGIGADRVPQRTYPGGSVAGNVIGFTGDGGKALAGAELTYDKQLRGTDGKTEYERGAQGQIIPTGHQETTPAVDGEDLVLTLDQDLQWKTQQILANTVKKWNGSGGSAVVYNVKTGEVLTLADYPTYDPNAPGKTDEKYRGNQSLSNVFEPGSTGKLLTAASALEEGEVTPKTQYEVPYTKSFDGEKIKDSHYHPDQKLTLAGVLKNSSNVGIVQVGESMEPATRYQYLRDFGMGQKTGVNLPGESAGILHPADEWKGRTRYTTDFGQGYAVTPLQIVAAIGSFGNDGVRLHPTLIAGTRDEDGTMEPAHHADGTRVVSDKTAHTMLRLMDNDVDDATEDSNPAVPNYAVGGKTGTAQVADGTYTASFIGMAPIDDPELAVGVFVYGLKTFISGNTAAAPAFSDVMGYALQTQRIPPTGVKGKELENEW